jgi:hypothetical protein
MGLESQPTHWCESVSISQSLFTPFALGAFAFFGLGDLQDLYTSLTSDNTKR